MPLSPGTRLGHYDVTALLGEGGMGQVWQATDTQLNRQVALKILPAAFAADPDRLARFKRAAQILASLNHPNIAAIYGIEQRDDTKALVVELVDGPTLADRIAQGPMPLDEALPVAKQVGCVDSAARILQKVSIFGGPPGDADRDISRPGMMNGCAWWSLDADLGNPHAERHDLTKLLKKLHKKACS